MESRPPPPKSKNDGVRTVYNSTSGKLSQKKKKKTGKLINRTKTCTHSKFSIMFSYILYLSVERFERFFDLLPLSVGPSGQHVDDGLFVGTESFHGGSEHGGVGVGVEILGRAYRGCALQEKRKRENGHRSL